jgi:diacylglycerol O-acyltransferase/trehalose O-mycolyltransferase
MRALGTVLVAVLAVVLLGTPARAAAPAVVAEHWLDSREVDLTVHSPANDKDFPVRLLVPAGWSRTAGRTWPVLYLLHGGNDNYTSWTRETDIEALSAAAQVLIVMPDAGLDANYADWYDTGGGPNAGLWETFHLTELWQVLRDGYRAGTQRSIAGISSGGTGAITYAARHPGMFKFAAAYSAPLNLFDPVMQPVLLNNTAENGDDPMAVWGSPDLQKANWQQHNPLDLATKLRGTGLYFSSGTTGLPGDLDPNGSWSLLQLGEASIGATTAQMVGRLLLGGIPATVHLYLNGTHSWPYWQRELHASWPALLGSLGAG